MSLDCPELVGLLRNLTEPFVRNFFRSFLHPVAPIVHTAVTRRTLISRRDGTQKCVFDMLYNHFAAPSDHEFDEGYIVTQTRGMPSTYDLWCMSPRCAVHNGSADSDIHQLSRVLHAASSEDVGKKVGPGWAKIHSRHRICSPGRRAA